MDALQREENKAAQAEEREALEAIYGEDYRFHPDDQLCEIDVHPAGEDRIPAAALRLGLYFVDSYPAACEPVVEFRTPWVSEETKQKILAQFGEIYRQGAGDVLIFKWVDWLQGQRWVWEESKSWVESTAARNDIKVFESTRAGGRVLQATFLAARRVLGKHEKMKGRHTSAPQRPAILYGVTVGLKLRNDTSQQNLPAEGGEQEEKRKLEKLDEVLGIVHGPPFTERKSVFQAHVAPVQDADHVELVMDALLRNRKIAQATHNIMAYRIKLPDKGTLVQDFDDDGETAAGGRLMHLLQIVDACNVMVVVSRWFGGVLLGPDRFRVINNTARSLLSTLGYINGSGSANVQGKTASKTVTPASRKGKKK